MRFYNFMVGLNCPGNYAGKILLVSFLGVHVPVIGLAVFAVFFGPLPVSETWPFLVATLVFTGLGTSITLWANYALLAPVRAASAAMRDYLSEKKVASLPVNSQDDAGRLMTDVVEGITRLDHAIDAAHAARDESEEKHRSTFALLSEMSHELRTPLNHIIGFSELMQNESLRPLGENGDSEYAGLINASGGQLLKLIEGILELSAIESDQVEMSAEHVDAVEMARNAFGLTHHHAVGKQVSLDIFELSPVAVVEADPRAVKQVYLQSMMAVMDSASEGGSVSVALTTGDGTVELKVSDTGRQFVRDDIPVPLRSQFGNAFAADDVGSEIRNASKTGLQLVVVHALVRRIGGQLVLENDPSGAGKSITVCLPAVHVQAVSAAPEVRKAA